MGRRAEFTLARRACARFLFGTSARPDLRSGPLEPGVPGSSGSATPGVLGGWPRGAGTTSSATMRKPDGKIVLLGDMNVGKTSLLQRYMERRFPDTVSTVGGAFYLKQWRSLNISIWDTAGEGGAAGTGCLQGSAGPRTCLPADAMSPPRVVAFTAPLSPLVPP